MGSTATGVTAYCGDPSLPGGHQPGGEQGTPSVELRGNGMHHPWRKIRGLVHWTVHFTHDLPDGVTGVTRWGDRTIWVAHGLTQVERRCVAEHERQHALRGPGGAIDQDERVVEIAAAHALIELEDLARAARWARSKDELADELFVTRDVLDVRLAHLHPAERAYLKKELAEETGA